MEIVIPKVMFCLQGCRVIGVPGPSYNSTNAMENLVQEITHEEEPDLVPAPNNTLHLDAVVETETHDRERRSAKVRCLENTSMN